MSNSEALPRSFNYCLGHVLQLVDSEYSFDLSEQPIRQTEVAVGVRMIAAVVCASKSWSRRRTPGGLALVRQNLGKRSALGLFAESTVAGNTPLFVDRMLCIRYMFHLLLYYELSSSM